MLKFKNIELVAGKKELFKLCDLELHKGLYALVGRNGVGKSSLIKAILNEFELRKGEISLNNKELNFYTRLDLAKNVAVVYSRVEIFGDLIVKDIILLGRLPYQNLFAKTQDEDLEMVKVVAEDLGITNLLVRKFNRLSDGEKQLVMIARAFVQDTPLILLDEPSAFLDLVNRNILIQLLNKYATSKNKLIIFSTHDIDLLDKYCDGVLFINEQKLKLLDKSLSFLKQIKESFNLN